MAKPTIAQKALLATINQSTWLSFGEIREYRYRPVTLRRCLDRGWIDLAAVGFGRAGYQLTPAGRAALEAREG